ncbi:MAG: phenylacetate-CoA oxygenase subunit PaaJ [Alphaproteobacteria bacterium]|nr:MAG: phenylacetate-CoA oxygenase subunit PaaJ [Alphaproteobacteria bacterium]
MASQPSSDVIEQRIFDVLAQVPDPEIPAVSIVDLGIVRGVSIDGDQAAVALTPTYSGCPATHAIELAARLALDEAGLEAVTIRTVLSPAWSTEMISAEGREKLRRYGIAPPVESGGPAECPRCGSRDTHEVSRFGSTPCKALWRCNSCSEPFDRFKCH